MSNFKTFANVALYTIGELIPRILSFLLLPVLTKYLSTSDYGISGYINTVVTFLFVFTTLSVNTYALRSYYKFNSEVEKKKLLGNIFLFLIGWGLIMLCLEILLFPFILNTFSVQAPFYPYFLLALIINFFDVISIIPLIAYRVNEDAKGFVILSVGRTILQYILILLLVAGFNMGLLGSYLGRLIACIPFFLIYFIIIKKKGIFCININQIKNALRFSLPLLPGALSYLIISIFDRVILERYVSLSELGLFSVASTLALTLNMVIQGFYRSFEQKIFREHNNKEYLQVVDKLYKIYLSALYIPGFLLTLFSKEILFFFTSNNFYKADIYVVYLVVAVLISGTNIFLGTLLIADNRRKIVSYSSFTSAIFSFIANLMLIKYYGVLGACIASILSFLVVYVFYNFKLVLLNKYMLPQVFFIIIFFSINFFLPTTMPLVIVLLIKLLLVAAFLLILKKTMKIQIPSLSALKNLKIFPN